MEARAKEIGKGGELFYIFPNNGAWLKDADGDKAEALGMRAHLVSDIHLGGGGGVERARAQVLPLRWLLPHASCAQRAASRDARGSQDFFLFPSLQSLPCMLHLCVPVAPDVVQLLLFAFAFDSLLDTQSGLRVRQTLKPTWAFTR